VAAVCFNLGSYFAGGSYEVVWSLYMTSLGADIGLIGLSFFSFGLPPLLLSPFMGRFIDREGGYVALVAGMTGIAVCGFVYPIVPAVWWMIVIGLVEGTAFAAASPAIYLLVARSAPVGKSSTAQGLLGGAGTVGTIIASVAAGRLADIDLALPFYSVGIAGTAAILVGLALGRRRLYQAMQPRATASGPPVAIAPVPGSGA
jgi:MFS family permease